MKITFCDFCGRREDIKIPIRTFVLENGSTKDICYGCYKLAEQKVKFINDVIKRYKQEKDIKNKEGEPT